MGRCALGFVLELVNSTSGLLDACTVRAQAYGRHLPDMGRRLSEPDELDFAPATTVFVCRDKADGRPVGTMRIQSSACGPLLMEGSVSLPPWLRACSRAEVTRLAVAVGADPLVRLSLWKASYLFCMAHRIDWMVVGARNEALIRNYRRLGFVDLFGPDQLMPLAHTGGLPHRILAFDNASADRQWRQLKHPLYGFVVETEHAELQACTQVQPHFEHRAGAALPALPVPA